MLFLLQFLEIWPIVSSSAFSIRKTSNREHHQQARSEPCLFPRAFTKNWDIFCQYDYHKIQYMCDPTGILSRTEVEMLDVTVKSLNMTSCFCGSTCDPHSGSRLGIVVIPNTTLYDLEFCDKTVDRSLSASLPISAYQYGLLLNQHWADQCNVDLMLLYIRIWISDRVVRPFIVPIYANSFQRFQRFSRPVATNIREPVLSVLQRALKQNKKIIESEQRETNTSIPDWAKLTAVGMVSFVCLAFYIANCVTNKMGKTQQKSKTSVASTRKSSDRFRAGFGGGMIMNQTQQKKSVMMFRTFSKTPRNNVNRL